MYLLSREGEMFEINGRAGFFKVVRESFTIDELVLPRLESDVLSPNSADDVANSIHGVMKDIYWFYEDEADEGRGHLVAPVTFSEAVPSGKDLESLMFEYADLILTPNLSWSMDKMVRKAEIESVLCVKAIGTWAACERYLLSGDDGISSGSGRKVRKI